MARDKTITAKIDTDLYDAIVEDAELLDVTVSQWVADACDNYIHLDDLTWEDLEEWDWDTMVDFVEGGELDIDPDGFSSFWTGKDEDGLRLAIAEELGIELEEEEEEEED